MIDFEVSSQHLTGDTEEIHMKKASICDIRD
jgi:hypothetical protein